MFRLTKIEGGRINVFEPLMYTVGSSAVTAGQALVLNAGVLVAASGKPTFIALSNGAAGDSIAVGRVESNQLYEVKGAPSGIIVGGKYCLASNGTSFNTTALDASVDGGVEVVSYDSTTSTATVRFVSYDKT
jgi:hypothetical protein